MKKLTKRAASLLVAAAMCVPAVTSAAAAEGVDYDRIFSEFSGVENYQIGGHCHIYESADLSLH